MSVTKALNIDDNVAVPAGVYTPQEFISNKSPFGILYFKNNMFHIRVGGSTSISLKNKFVVS